MRVEDLLQRLSLAERVQQLSAARDAVGAIERLGIPAFQGWNGVRACSSVALYDLITKPVCGHRQLGHWPVGITVINIARDSTIKPDNLENVDVILQKGSFTLGWRLGACARSW